MTSSPAATGGAAADLPPAALATVADCLARIDRLDGAVRAVITANAQGALEAAQRCDTAGQEGARLGPLHGMPVSLKDNIDTAGLETTCGSAVFAGRLPREDATVVRRLAEAGAVVVAKTNMGEFAFGGTTQNPHYGSCRNPWDLDRLAGGSSGGAGAALALGMCEGALGTDTGGSARIPAALCGVTALRPTVGRVPTRGVLPVCVEFDTVAPMAREVGDVARLLAAIEGHDPEDATSRPLPGGTQVPPGALREGIAGLRVGVGEAFFMTRAEPAIVAAVRTALRVLEDLGAVLVPLDLAGAEGSQERMTRMVFPASAALHRERAALSGDKMGADVLRRIRLGSQILAVEYAEADAWRRSWAWRVARALDTVDVIACPTVPVTAPLADEAELIATTDRLAQFTSPWSMAGTPALTLPCGLDGEGLPVGLQLVSAPWRELTLLRTGWAFQSVTDWHRREPAIARA